MRVWGAAGGNSELGGAGGKGAIITGSLAVTPGSVLTVATGAAGVTVPYSLNIDTSHSGGGGAGFAGAGSGGGATTVMIGIPPGAPFLIAAGGGGASQVSAGSAGADPAGYGQCGQGPDSITMSPCSFGGGGGGGLTIGGFSLNNGTSANGTAGIGGSAGSGIYFPTQSGGGGGGLWGGGAGTGGPGGSGSSSAPNGFTISTATELDYSESTPSYAPRQGFAERSIAATSGGAVFTFDLGGLPACASDVLTIERDAGYSFDGAQFGGSSGSIAIINMMPNLLPFAVISASAAGIGGTPLYFIALPNDVFDISATGKLSVRLGVSLAAAAETTVGITVGAYAVDGSCVAQLTVDIVIISGYGTGPGSSSPEARVATCPAGFARASPSDAYCYGTLGALDDSALTQDAAFALCAAAAPAWRKPALAGFASADGRAAVLAGLCGHGSWTSARFDGTSWAWAAGTRDAADFPTESELSAATTCADNGDGSVSTVTGNQLDSSNGVAGFVSRTACAAATSAPGYVGARLTAVDPATPLAYACCEMLHTAAPPVPSGIEWNSPPQWSEFSSTGAFHAFVPPRGPVNAGGDIVFQVTATDLNDAATPAGTLTYKLMSAAVGDSTVDPSTFSDVFVISPDATQVMLVGSAVRFKHKTIRLEFSVADGLGASPTLGTFSLYIIVTRKSPAGLPPSHAPPPYPFSGIVAQCVSRGGECKVVAANRKNTPATNVLGYGFVPPTGSGCNERSTIVGIRLISWSLSIRYRRWYALTALPTGETAPTVLAYMLVRNRYEVQVDLAGLVSDLPRDIDRLWLWAYDHAETVWRPVQAIGMRTPCYPNP